MLENLMSFSGTTNCDFSLMFIGPCIIMITEELKNQLDATYYFIVLLIGSTCFGHYYAHPQELATSSFVGVTTHYGF